MGGVLGRIPLEKEVYCITSATIIINIKVGVCWFEKLQKSLPIQQILSP